MLNGVKHLLLLTGGFCFPRTRFFVATLLRMTMCRSLLFRESPSTEFILSLVLSLPKEESRGSGQAWQLRNPNNVALDSSVFGNEGGLLPHRKWKY